VANVTQTRPTLIAPCMLLTPCSILIGAARRIRRGGVPAGVRILRAMGPRMQPLLLCSRLSGNVPLR
jgi:hypothetical protein